MKIYGLKNCDNCRKAAKAFPEAELRDVRDDGVPQDVLRAAQAVFGDALVNTRSTTWRGLTEAERAMGALELIVAHPAVMKRPLIVVDNAFFIGWSKDVEAEIQALL